MTDYQGLRELAEAAHVAAEAEKAESAAQEAAALLAEVTVFAASVLGEAAAVKLVWEDSPFSVRGMMAPLDKGRTIVVSWLSFFECYRMIARIECGECHARPVDRDIRDLSDLWVAMEYRCPHQAYDSN